ncbi:hypothetical protein L486_01015 [Kwoniella mangroviensis CBS 10435]|uniref:Anaphase-promoting complex subunit 4 n=1 Tax=Kwoniella mangroviensis CBS 10435 TaxID=1331196 RepID=A0A1B9J0R0_9TREE|nr:uncharacterized protein I203_06058 [Kwoniella mangroviensis CBS 8507]OCF61367.1 hypothetical protein L486_01015 [Kwoniella mangroviensis CBS 10435]OCF64814.1 hypothetical protein I203_06058 [Kwoniella mangroviensis CBS 8507]
MIFPDRTSFTPLSIIPLPSSHMLHPRSCNPAMDLIVLLSLPSPSTSTSGSLWKGKGKEIGSKTQISLWRTGGSKVWQVGVEGDVQGLAWNEDGLILSLLSSSSNGNFVHHLSVHTGEIIWSVPVPSDLIDENRKGRWVEMKWKVSQNGWAKVKNGSALDIIDSLPTVTPVDPPKPPNQLPFMRQAALTQTPPKPTIHPSLSTFPALLPSTIPLQPDILHIGSSEYSLLTGTFASPSDSEPSQEMMELSKISDKIVHLLDIILRGIENAEIHFREGDKQTMICREDLETCAKQQAMSIQDVHSDLFRFLMTGRSGVAVNEWMGNRLTGRTITKWDQTLDTSFRTIQNLIIESISPALERLVLLLEEMRGWSRTPKYQTQLQLNENDISKAIDLVLGFAKLVEGMRRDAEHELKAASEFMKWLKYASQDPSSDDLPLPTHDLKSVWSFMSNGFVRSSFHDHFPYLLVRPPKDTLPSDHTTYPRKTTRSLDEVLKETSQELQIDHPRNVGVVDTPSVQANESLGSEDTSMDMSISGINEVQDDDGDLTPTGILSDDEEENEGISRFSSPDTVGNKYVSSEEEEEEVKRVMEKEPWVWANTLIRDLEGLVKSAVGRAEGDGAERIERDDELELNLRDKRLVDGGLWEVVVLQQDDMQRLWLLSIGNANDSLTISKFATFSISEARCLSIRFFDDEEIVLLMESENGRYLTTLRYPDISDEMVELPAMREWRLVDVVREYRDAFEDIPSIPIGRSRYLGPTPQSDDILERDSEIALNGRKGRRLGCILYEDGKEVQVWDLDVDEDDEEEEEGEEMDGVEE